jgi:hypothetical protein
MFGTDTPREVMIMEPCNYASNVAYYHSAVRFCDYPDWNFDQETVILLKRAMTTLGSGSPFMHGSHTQLGFFFDNNVISVIAFTGYRSILAKLGGSNSTILNCLQETECID